MKIEAKLGSTYLILILAMLTTSTIAYLRMSEVSRITNKFAIERVPIVFVNRSARMGLAKGIRLQEEALLFGENPTEAAQYYAQYRSQWSNTNKDMDRLSDMGKQFDLGEDNVRIRNSVEESVQLHQLQDHIEDLIESRQPENISAARALIHDQMHVQEQALYQNMFDMVSSENSALDTESQKVIRATDSMVWTLWITTLTSAILGGLLAMTIARRTSRSLRLVVDRATAIAQGDLSGPPLLVESNDEVSLLANTMQQMQESLRETIGAVAHTAAKVTGNAISIGESGKEMHAKMDVQNRQTELTASAVHQMSASVAEVSRHAVNAAKNARSAAETARKGGETVREMLGSMNSIDAAVRSTSNTIHLLGEDSARISRIVHVIKDIASKTNLLALNAAIEAARAGEHGRGFAVVATEVRALAESTAEATNEISQMIRGIQERTGTAVSSMNEGTKTVAAGMLTTTSAGEALEQIIGMVEQVDRMIAQIALASEQQSTSASDSSESLNSIYQLGSENLRAMSSSVSGAENLREAALELKRQIERFHVDETISYEIDPSPNPQHPILFRGLAMPA
jgi:methyl-accepting chemotaxis protein